MLKAGFGICDGNKVGLVAAVAGAFALVACSIFIVVVDDAAVELTSLIFRLLILILNHAAGGNYLEH